MSEIPSSEASSSRSLRLPSLNVWHLCLLTAFVAVAIRNIQDQRMSEPKLIALAALGFAGYGILGGLGWSLTKRLEPRLGKTAGLSVYLAAMSLLFLLATWIYLVLEYRFRNG